MLYTMKTGILYQEPTHQAVAKMKGGLTGPVKEIYTGGEEPLMEAKIQYNETESTADVRSKEYLLLDHDEHIVAEGHPEYAAGEAPEEAGWPVCRMPRVDHAEVELDGAKDLLTMGSGQSYTLSDAQGRELLRIRHRGILGGWNLEDSYGFAPEVLCGLFAFCRYIEQENELLIA